jgi:hypothetical protein
VAKAKQESLKGMTSDKIKEIDTAMEDYVEVRDKRMQLTPQEVGARKHLETVMKKHGKKIYKNSDGDMVAKIVPKEEKAKVKSIEADETGGED